MNAIPGNYKATQDSIGDVYISTDDGRQIAMLENWNPDAGEIRFATGILLAAAPELLAALRDVLVSLEPHETPGDSAINAAITFARAAIAKAKGEA